MNKQEAKQKLHNIAFAKMNARPDELKLADVMQVIDQIHEPQKVVVPAQIGKWLKTCKTSCLGGQLSAALQGPGESFNDSEAINIWLEYPENQETFARAWLDGYEIEQEKLYTVELFNGQPLVEVNNILHFSSNLVALNASVSKDKLEEAGFGWVFDCKGVKVVEVKND